MWSAIPFALLCMIVNLSERKQGSGPEGDEVLLNTGGLSFIRLFVLRADIKPERTDCRPGRADFWPKRVDFRPEGTNFRLETLDFRAEGRFQF